MFLYADNEDSDQTTRMRKLIWVYVGSTCQKVFFHVVAQVYSWFYAQLSATKLPSKVVKWSQMKKKKKKWTTKYGAE